MPGNKAYQHLKPNKNRSCTNDFWTANGTVWGCEERRDTNAIKTKWIDLLPRETQRWAHQNSDNVGCISDVGPGSTWGNNQKRKSTRFFSEAQYPSSNMATSHRKSTTTCSCVLHKGGVRITIQVSVCLPSKYIKKDKERKTFCLAGQWTERHGGRCFYWSTVLRHKDTSIGWETKTHSQKVRGVRVYRSFNCTFTEHTRDLCPNTWRKTFSDTHLKPADTEMTTNVNSKIRHKTELAWSLVQCVCVCVWESRPMDRIVLHQQLSFLHCSRGPFHSPAKTAALKHLLALVSVGDLCLSKYKLFGLTLGPQFHTSALSAREQSSSQMKREPSRPYFPCFYNVQAN